MACGHTIHYRRLQETTGDYRRLQEIKSSQVNQVNQVRAVAFSSLRRIPPGCGHTGRHHPSSQAPPIQDQASAQQLHH